MGTALIVGELLDGALEGDSVGAAVVVGELVSDGDSVGAWLTVGELGDSVGAAVVDGDSVGALL